MVKEVAYSCEITGFTLPPCSTWLNRMVKSLIKTNLEIIAEIEYLGQLRSCPVG